MVFVESYLFIYVIICVYSFNQYMSKEYFTGDIKDGEMILAKLIQLFSISCSQLQNLCA